MGDSSPLSQPDWQLFLSLGEDLLSTNSAREQAHLIEQFILKHLNSQGRFILPIRRIPFRVNPIYPGT